MKSFKKLLSLLMAFAMILALCAGCGSTESADTSAPDSDTADTASNGDAFRFGGIGPLTGEAAIYGNAAMNGAKIAVDEINALGGTQIVFQPEDDENDAEKAVNAYNVLLDWDMQVLVGVITTTPCLAVSELVYTDRVFALTPSASSADVVAGKDNMFQVCFSDPNQGTAAADYVSQNMGDATIAIIYKNDDAYSQGIRDTFVAEAEDIGLSIVYEGTFTTDTQTDFSVQLTAAQNAGADFIFLPIYYTPASVILSQANDMGYAPTFFGVDGMDGLLTLKGFNTELAEGVLLLTPFAADATDEKTQNFVKTYESLYGETPNQFAADGYDTVYILYNALQAAGCTPDMSAEEICNALVEIMPTISYDGITGEGMTWNENGEVSKAPRAVVIKDGVYVTP